MFQTIVLPRYNPCKMIGSRLCAEIGRFVGGIQLHYLASPSHEHVRLARPLSSSNQTSSQPARVKGVTRRNRKHFGGAAISNSYGSPTSYHGSWPLRSFLCVRCLLVFENDVCAQPVMRSKTSELFNASAYRWILTCTQSAVLKKEESSLASAMISRACA